MSAEMVVGEFRDRAQAEAAVNLLRAQGFQVEDLHVIGPKPENDADEGVPVGVSETPGDVLVRVHVTDRHEAARALLCEAGAVETDFSLVGDEATPTGDA